MTNQWQLFQWLGSFQICKKPFCIQRWKTVILTVIILFKWIFRKMSKISFNDVWQKVTLTEISENFCIVLLFSLDLRDLFWYNIWVCNWFIFNCIPFKSWSSIVWKFEYSSWYFKICEIKKNCVSEGRLLNPSILFNSFKIERKISLFKKQFFLDKSK